MLRIDWHVTNGVLNAYILCIPIAELSCASAHVRSRGKYSNLVIVRVSEFRTYSDGHGITHSWGMKPRPRRLSTAVWTEPYQCRSEAIRVLCLASASM